MPYSHVVEFYAYLIAEHGQHQYNDVWVHYWQLAKHGRAIPFL